MTESFLRRVGGYLRFGSIPKRLVNRTFRSGQAMVEFALIASIALIVLLVGIQFAIIGQAALAVSQGSYYAARYAAVQTDTTSGNIQSRVSSQFSPTITSPSGALTVGMTTNATDPSCGPPRVFGCTIQVQVGYNATSKIVLGNSFFGVSFPRQLNSTTQMMTE